MQHIIYFNRKPLLLTDSRTDLDIKRFKKPTTFFQEELNEKSVVQMLEALQSDQTTGGGFLHTDVNALLNAFKEKMQVIRAGGGLVYTDDKKILLIFRRGKWDLPKGKLDKEETIEAAAVREVGEETGLRKIRLGAFLTTTYHTYYEKGKLILKESHWFLMKTNATENLVPQLEEDIEKCEWVYIADLATYLENTHPSIIDVLKTGIKKLNTATDF